MGVGKPGHIFHLREQERVRRIRIGLIVHQQILFRESVAIAEMDDFELHSIEANAHVPVLAVDQRLAMLQVDDVIDAGILLREIEPRAVVEDVAVLQDFDVGGAAVRRGFPQRVLQVLLEDVHRARHERRIWRRSTRPSGLNGGSAVPYGVDFVFLPNSEVGEYWPFVNP